MRRHSARRTGSTECCSLRWHRMGARDVYDLFKKNTTIHGVPDMLTAPRWDIRLLFCFLVISAIGASMYGCYRIWSDYHTRNVIVSYFTTEADELLLPDIAICPFNRFNRSFLEQHNISGNLAEYMELSYNILIQQKIGEQFMLLQSTVDNVSLYRDEMNERLANAGNVSLDEFFEMALLGCETFLKYPRNVCNRTTYISTSLGKCFRVQGIVQKGEGHQYGSRFVLKIPYDLYSYSVNQWWDDGFAIKLADMGQGMDNDISFIAPGTHTVIPLTATKYEFMNDPPYHVCRNGSADYSRLWCYERCMMEDVEKECGCALAAAQFPTINRTCNGYEILDCFYSHPTQNESMPEYMQLVNKCKNECIPPCSYWTYEKSITHADYPSKRVQQHISPHARDTIVIDMYYVALEYTTIRHIVNMSRWNLIAELGGHVSLWIGASLVSFAQLLIYFSYMCGYSLIALVKKAIRCLQNRREQDENTKCGIEVDSKDEDASMIGMTSLEKIPYPNQDHNNKDNNHVVEAENANDNSSPYQNELQIKEHSAALAPLAEQTTDDSAEELTDGSAADKNKEHSPPENIVFL